MCTWHTGTIHKEKEGSNKNDKSKRENHQPGWQEKLLSFAMNEFFGHHTLNCHPVFGNQ
jgi:hypothetical protein